MAFAQSRWYPALTRLGCILLGLLLVFSYAPFAQAWLTLPVLILLVLLLRDKTPREAWQLGYFFGLGWFTAGLSWIYVSIDTFGGLHPLATVAILLLLYLYLSLFPALAFWAWRWLSTRFHAQAYWTLPLTWLAAETLRGWLFTGFPWLELGYTQTDTWLANYAPWFGGSAITVVLFTVALLSVHWLRQRTWHAPALIAALLLIPLVLPQLTAVSRTSDNVSIALVQGNINQSIKWDPDQHWPNLSRYLDLSRPLYADHDVIIWPESAVTMPEPYTDDILEVIHDEMATTQTAFITGIIDIRKDNYYNSVIALGQDGAQGVAESYQHGHSNRYQKHQLLPIGEFVPFGDLLRPLAPLFNLPMSSFSRGDAVQEPLRAHGWEFSTAICYEIAFPGHVRANMTGSTDFLLTVSNDTWFGRSHGPAQHMQIARMRAIELGRPLIRATNSGITAMVDEHGDWLARAPQFESTTLSAKVPLVSGITPYYLWGAYGTWLLAVLIAILGVLPVVNRRQKK
ncbi:apolipoprotein N-acyltransferase [Pseudidiomarina sp. 1APR75-33.1]|uniref:apolipoprotein N-acyltransferase n=1 Tax=Pseudidiomarina terrestris TaxID=2820060 RepID=UPI0026535740|nr:apolipoprotein N-acyltransferase [Pseudidiomarina sp. 1APR75-33.1]MDN7127821.1 apolipoprotein N-acyltransferase [Pseudidiomarina sp. 1APR75-33.1]